AILPFTAADGSACPIDPECGAPPDPNSSGAAELPGSSFIVALGTFSDNTGIDFSSIGVETFASLFMHELGHNFGLKHGSLAAPAPQTCLAYKPNYLSVMNYCNYANGITVATEPGSATPRTCTVDSDCPIGVHCTNDLGGTGGGNVCYRLDYSR